MPIYSCIKCYNIFEYNKKYKEVNEFTKIINKRNNMSFCVYQNELLRNCSEAINNTKDGIEKYDCIKCIDNNILVYNYENNIKYCQYFQIIQKCMVKYC